MFDGKIAMITGAGSGIGRQIALSMAKYHATIVVSDMNLKLADETAELIKMMGEKTIAVKCNVANNEEVLSSVKKAIDNFGKIDILINNAGVFKESEFLNIPEEMWELHINVNLKGAYNCIMAVAPYMVKEKKGSIVNIASIDAFQGCKGFTPYCAAKAGVLGLTKNFALELAAYGIRVNAIAPGIIETNMTRERIERNKKWYLERIILNRMGKPEDIANAAVFLSSDMSDYITGQTLHVNGGMRFN